MFLLASVFYMGCGGSQLTPEEEAKYEKLQAERSELASDRKAMTADVDRAFKRSGTLEGQGASRVDDVLACGQRSLQNQSFGPLPFRKKKDKSAHIIQSGSARSGCQAYTLKVR